VMDGLQGLQNGPVCSNFSTSITQDQMNMRMVLAGRDAVAVDAVAALVMGFDPVKLELLRWLQESGGGVCDPLAVRVAGPPLDEVRTEFASWGEETASERNTDLDPPVLTIHTAEVDGDVLVLDVELDEPGRLEIALDGERLDGHVLQDLDHVVIDIGHLAAGDHTLTLTALDEALNATSEERTITVG